MVRELSDSGMIPIPKGHVTSFGGALTSWTQIHSVVLQELGQATCCGRVLLTQQSPAAFLSSGLLNEARFIWRE